MLKPNPKQAFILDETKTALVTGCSSGIGRATALLLGERGYNVYASARKLSAIRHLERSGSEKGWKLKAIELDVSDEKSVSTAKKLIERRDGGVDILVNNAGYGLAGPVEDVPIEEVRTQFDTNFFGLILLCQAFLPGMRARRFGKIVNVSSIAGRIAIPFFGIYNASKFALEAVSDALRLEVKPYGVDVIVIEPGPVKTRFRETAEKLGSRIVSRRSTYYQAYTRCKERLGKNLHHGSTAEDVAKLILKTIEARNPRPRYQVRLVDSLVLLLKRLTPDQLFDFGVKKTFGVE